MSKDAWHDRRFAAEWDDAGNLFTNPDRERQLALLADLLAAARPAHLLDLGVGSAQVEAAIARRHPDFFATCRVTGIDASEAMLELARQRREHENLSGLELLRGDFASLDEVEPGTAPDAVICVQALHEVPHAVKQSVFARVRDWLAPRAPFYILDRFDYAPEPWQDDWRAIWNWMASASPRAVLDFDEYQRRYRAKTDHVASVEDYRGWLEAAGYATQCAYRCFNRALIIARAGPA